jgi:hypothetical protein
MSPGSPLLSNFTPAVLQLIFMWNEVDKLGDPISDGFPLDVQSKK